MRVSRQCTRMEPIITFGSKSSFRRIASSNGVHDLEELILAVFRVIRILPQFFSYREIVNAHSPVHCVAVPKTLAQYIHDCRKQMLVESCLDCQSRHCSRRNVGQLLAPEAQVASGSDPDADSEHHVHPTDSNGSDLLCNAGSIDKTRVDRIFHIFVQEILEELCIVIRQVCITLSF
ncbi:hypothetical protein Mapa_002959 [Marchantia paleacea]|nr:hypothetical protein Mapa_002959 [Marchantia paleacea]